MIACLRRSLAAGLLVLLTACASTPQATADRDRAAKAFDSQQGSSTLYVFRPEFPGPDEDTVLWVNGRLIGATLPKTYFRISTSPGMQYLSGYAGDNGTMQLDTRPGNIYFVRLHTVGGQSVFEPVESATGRRELTECCELLENWRPGQRPLLR